MFTKAFWKAVGERALKAFASTSGALLTANVVGETVQDQPNVFHMDVVSILQVSATASIISVLLNIASGAFTQAPGPSLTKAEQVVEPAPPGD